MKRQHIDDELAAPGAQELLESTSAAHLAYLATDGTPRVVPIGFFWTGDEIVMATATTAPKARALAHHPHVAVSIDVGDTPATARALSMRGRANVEIVDGPVPEFLAAARKSMDPDAVPAFEQNVRQTYRQMARIGITPTWARFYDFGAGRMPGFLQELMAQSQA